MLDRAGGRRAPDGPGRRGVKVTVAARRGHLSNRLRLAATEVVYLNGIWEASARSAG